MEWTKEKDIIENIRIGMKIAWYRNANLREDTLQEGIVTSIEECISCRTGKIKKSMRTSREWICNKKIGINGNDTDCFCYGYDVLVIKYIRDTDFIEEDEFKL